MKSAWLYFLALMFVAFGTPALAVPTSAPLTICNRSPETIYVAVGYYSSGVDASEHKDVLTGPFVSRGWTGVQVGACQTFANPFDARYMFWYAFGKGLNDHKGDMIYLGATFLKYQFCINSYLKGDGKPVPDFVYEDENASFEACDPSNAVAGRPYNPNPANWWVSSRKVDTAVDPTVNFDGCPANLGHCEADWNGPRGPQMGD